MLDEHIKEAVHRHVHFIEQALVKIEQGVDVTDRIIGDAKEIAELFDSVEKSTLASIIRHIAYKTKTSLAQVPGYLAYMAYKTKTGK